MNAKILAVLLTLAGGYVAVVNRMLPGQAPAPVVQAERSDGGMWRKLGEIDARVAQHVTQSEALVGEWRRDQEASSERLRKLEEQAINANRKLDLLLYKANINQQIGSTVHRPPAIAIAPVPLAGAGGQR